MGQVSLSPSALLKARETEETDESEKKSNIIGTAVSPSGKRVKIAPVSENRSQDEYSLRTAGGVANALPPDLQPAISLLDNIRFVDLDVFAMLNGFPSYNASAAWV